MLQTFLVLGLIPGTNIEIGFFVWAALFVALTIFGLRYAIGYHRQVKAIRLMLDLRLSQPASLFHSRLR